MKFDGGTYDPDFDERRLNRQFNRILDLMKDGDWRTLGEIERATGDPQASISAQLRHLRKKRFGSHIVNRRPRGDRAHGLYEYQVLCRFEQEVLQL
jgi:predicted transcriptional regulator